MAADRSKLTLRLFGPPQAELDGVVLDLEHRKPAALLAYLAVTGQVHTRDALAAHFWPETARSRTYLRNSLWIITKALGAMADRWLLVEHDTVGLRQQPALWVDVTRFRQLWAAWQSHRHPQGVLCSDCLDRLTQAVHLYQRDFLAGFTLRDCPNFDEWSLFQSEQLRQGLAGILENLTHYYQAKGEFDVALVHAQRRLALDNLHEPAHYDLIYLYARASQRAAALRQYELCTHLLRTELDASPMAETTALYNAVIHGPSVTMVGPGMGKSTQNLQPATTAVAAWPNPALPHANPQPALSDHPFEQLLAQFSPLIGRDEERTALQRLCCDPTIRLITVTGPGGIGKTRLALQVASDLLATFADGCYFVALAPIREPALVMAAIAQTLGVSESSAQSWLQQVTALLHHRTSLLVLDNFEQVISAASLLSELLVACPGLTLMVTSRERLRLLHEHEFPTPPLAWAPSTTAPISPMATFPPQLQSAAVRLFGERARTVKADFIVDPSNVSTVAEICARVDGLPLAIELAAARIQLFSPQALLRRLTSQERATLKYLRGGRRDLPVRHHTLYDTIAWSYDLLTSAEQTLFRRLAIFVGGCTLEGAEAVGADGADAGDLQADEILDLLRSLLDKNLITHQLQADGEPRFGILETIREFGLAQLEATGELFTVQAHHAAYYLQLALLAKPHFRVATERRWVAQLELEHHNLRMALDWAIAQPNLEQAIRLGEALLEFWIRTNHWWEGAARLKRILALTVDLPPSSLLARFLFCVGLALEPKEGIGSVKPLYERSLAMSRALQDKGNITFALNKLGDIAFACGEYATWEKNLRESEPLKLEVGDHFHYALILGRTGYNLCQLGRFAEGLACCAKAVMLHRQLGDRWGLIGALGHHSQALLLSGTLTKAEQVAHECLTLAEALGAEARIAESHYVMGCILLAQGKVAKAKPLLQRALAVHVREERRYRILAVLEALAALALAQNQFRDALTLATFIARERRLAGLVSAPVVQEQFDGLIAAARQALPEAARAAAVAAGEKMTVTEAVDYVILRCST
ncbi:MAG: BTAD domain-containing putative transcriptional regulator [Caldilineaceae bacterium]